MQTSKTLAQYLIHHLLDHPDQKELVSIMLDLSTIGKIISRETNRAGVSGVIGSAEATNIQEEEVQKLDVLANEQCKSYLRSTGHFAALASEEEEGVVDMGEFGENANYVIAFDPLDGSSNIDVNVSIGTIFSVHKRLPNIPRTDERQFLQPGKDQVLAGYIVYGSSTVLVFSFGDGVHEFTLDQTLGEFLLSREQVTLPEEYNIYSTNEANLSFLQEVSKNFIESLRDSGKYKSRYIGSLVADAHRTLVKGGIFLYPKIDKKKKGEYKGKLRLNYEAKPIAFLFAQAGGLSVSESDNILEIVPDELHQRVGLVFGNKNIVENYTSNF